MLKDKKAILIVAILLIVIISGIIITFTKGVNYNLSYGQNTTIAAYINTQIDLNEIRDIVTEVFGRDNSIRKVDDLNNYLLITVKSANDEQIDTFVTKINEKYNLEITKDNLNISNNAKVGISDLVYPYIIPVLISSAIILIYFIVRYRKLGIPRVIISSILTVIGVQLIYLSAYAITRIPVNELTMSISMILFILSFILLIEKYEKDSKINSESQK